MFSFQFGIQCYIWKSFSEVKVFSQWRDAVEFYWVFLLQAFCSSFWLWVWGSWPVLMMNSSSSFESSLGFIFCWSVLLAPRVFQFSQAAFWLVIGWKGMLILSEAVWSPQQFQRFSISFSIWDSSRAAMFLAIQFEFTTSILQFNIQMQDSLNRFKVHIRLRPFFEDEKHSKASKEKTNCTQLYQEQTNKISLIRPNYDQRDFYFDNVHSFQTPQEEIFEKVARPVVRDVLDGYNGVIMAYGQTGSGKTHTIFGSRQSIDGRIKEDVHPQSGIVPRVVHEIFDHISANPNKAQFRMTVSFLEIYMEQITDLLHVFAEGEQNVRKSPSPMRHSNSSPNTQQIQYNNLQIREDPKTGIFVHGLKQIVVRDKSQLMHIVKLGAKRRTTNSTNMNSSSSRSHAVLQILIEQRWHQEQIGPSHQPTNSQQSQNSIQDSDLNARQHNVIQKTRHFRKALLTIVDLAGSERLSKTGSEGVRLMEAKNINKSIAALSNCISALASEKSLQHVPFRDSKLTRLLTESLGGNCKTTILACIGPSLFHYEESHSTLLFASRAFQVKNIVMLNEKIQVKIVDEQGHAIQPLQHQNSEKSTNEHLLEKKNKELEYENQVLKDTVTKMKEEEAKKASMISSFTSIPQSQMVVNGLQNQVSTQEMMGNNGFGTNKSFDHQAQIPLTKQYTMKQPEIRSPLMPRSSTPPPQSEHSNYHHISQYTQQNNLRQHQLLSPSRTVQDENYLGNGGGMQSDVPQSPHQDMYRRPSQIELSQQQESSTREKLKKANQCIQRLQQLLSHSQDELQEQFMEMERLRQENAEQKQRLQDKF